MFVVVGATGNTGSTVAEALLTRNQPIRVVVRSADKGAAWKAKGAEVAVGTLDDVATLAKAFAGARGVYLMVPPNSGSTAWMADQRTRMEHAAEAVGKSGIEHVVFLSSIGGHIPEGTGPIRALRYGEQALGAVAKHMTILRPCYFMENWAPVLGAAKAEGMLPTFIPPTTKIPMISTEDIGRVGAEQLLSGGNGRKVIELAGPEDYSPHQVAAALSALFGKKVVAQHTPLSAVVPTFTSMGVSDEAAKLYEEMYTALATTGIPYEHPSSVLRGRVPLSEALRGMA